MFIDASAMLAILLWEVDSLDMAVAIRNAPRRLTSPIALFETVSGLMRRKDLARTVAEEQVHALLAEAAIEVVAITGEIGHLAIDAFERYGKGRGHPAQLNMGDCFAYACAKAHGVRVLYKGADFGNTDLA